MDLRLFTLEQAPKSLPVWETILQDLGAPTAPRIARALDVGASTVYRWNQTGTAPRVACLALFWLTRWGRSEIHARATNDAMSLAALARALTDERNALRGRVAILAEERDRLTQVVQRFQALVDQRHAGAVEADRGSPAPAEAPALAWPELDPPALAWPVLSDPAGTPAVIGAGHLLRMRQAQPPAPSPAPAAGGWRHPAARSGAVTDQAGAAVQQRPTTTAEGLTRRASSSQASTTPSPRAPAAVDQLSEGLTVQARRLPPTVLGAGPQPPAALGAAGPGVFDAMAYALAPSHHQPGARWQAESERLDPPTSPTP